MPTRSKVPSLKQLFTLVEKARKLRDGGRAAQALELLAPRLAGFPPQSAFRWTDRYITTPGVAFSLLGELLAAAGRLQEASQAFDEAVERSGSTAVGVSLSILHVLVEAGQGVLARTRATSLLARPGLKAADRLWARRYLALGHVLAGEHAEARAVYAELAASCRSKAARAEVRQELEELAARRELGETVASLLALLA